jgi:hypothetical protein
MGRKCIPLLPIPYGSDSYRAYRVWYIWDRNINEAMGERMYEDDMMEDWTLRLVFGWRE